MIHIYTEKMQPATSFVDNHSDEPIQMGFDPDEMIYTNCCEKPRLASECLVQTYYDGTDVWCAPEKGCKDPQVIAEKKATQFKNRSEGQKKRYGKTNPKT
jgi:hypothetical protein